MTSPKVQISLEIDLNSLTTPIVICPRCGFTSLAELPIDKWYAVLHHMKKEHGQ